MSRQRSWKDEDFIAAVANSSSIRQALMKTGLKQTGENYRTFHKTVKRLNLKTDHFTGQSYLKGKTHNWSKSIPLIDILVEHSTYTSGKSLKKRLLREGILISHCYVCHINSWLSKPLSLQIDHINGTHDDNRKENLRLLCPNCHSQTDTFCGKNKQSHPKRQLICKVCQQSFYGRFSRQYCSSQCYQKKRNLDRIAEGIVTIKCIGCQKEFIGNYRRKYCTKECFRHQWYLSHKK